MDNENNTNQPKTKVFLRIVIVVFAVLAGLLLCAVAYIGLKLGKISSNDTLGDEADNSPVPVASEIAEPTETESVAATASPDEEMVVNYLLVGVDNDYLPGMDRLGNADGIMLLSLNTKTKQVVLTSIMRDISIYVPNKYYTKITLVYHQLGLQALIDTIEYNFDIEIDNYAMVNYLNVIEIVDALGGLELDIDENEIYYINSKMNNINYLTGDDAGTDKLSESDVGLTLLNGKQVAAWLRVRNGGGNDQKRTERARRAILAAKDKIEEMDLLELNSFSDVFLQNITTDITAMQALGLLAKIPAYLKYEFVSNRIPLEGTYTGDGSFIYIDYDANTEALHSAIYGDAE